MNKVASLCEENNYRQIYLQQARALRNFIYYRCGDLERAEDVAQDALIKLWENCAHILIEKAKSFLFTTAHNLMIDQIRHDKVKLEFAKRQPDEKSSDASFNLVQKEFEKKLMDGIGKLPETQREAFLMNRIDKMTYQEIAETLGISVKAVEKRMHLALQNLKEEVKELKIYKI